MPDQRKGIITLAFLVVTPGSLRAKGLQEAHNSVIGGHGGVFRTLERIRSMCWWPSMASKVAGHIKLCPVCGASPHTTKLHHGTPKPLPVPAGPNQRVHIDLYGPLKTSASGNKFVSVYTDTFTKMAWVRAISDKSAPTVASAILSIIYAFGVPRQIHSDQGLEFCNQLLHVICEQLNINRTTTTPYHPQCNAAAERFNRTMGQYLRKAIDNSDNSSLDWELYLCLLYTSPSPRDKRQSRMPSSA